MIWTHIIEHLGLTLQAKPGWGKTADHTLALCLSENIRRMRQEMCILCHSADAWQACFQAAGITEGGSTLTLAGTGVKELILIAQDLTWYGMDIYKRQALPELLKALSDIKALNGSGLHYAYPAAFPRDVIRVMKERENICNYLDIPFQHASDKVLQMMRRSHTRKQNYELIDYIRKEIPGHYTENNPDDRTSGRRARRNLMNSGSLWNRLNLTGLGYLPIPKKKIPGLPASMRTRFRRR